MHCNRSLTRVVLSPLLPSLGWLAALAALASLTSVPATATAGTIVVTVNATVSNAFGDLAGPLGPGSTLSGTVELDDAIVGSFTSSGDPTFLRSEMLYSGAVQSANLMVGGFAISGSGGDVLLRDATGSLAGEDNFEIIALLDTGSIGGESPQSIVLTAEYADTEFSVASNTPLFPPTFDATRFNPFTLTSTAGDTAFGQIDSLSSTGSPAVPVGSPVAWALLLAATVGMAHLALRRPHLTRH